MTDPAGTYSAAGASAPTTDPAGTYSAAGASAPTPAAAGTYIAGAGATSAAAEMTDRAGTYSAAGASAPTTDPAGTYSPAGASAANSCAGRVLCPDGRRQQRDAGRSRLLHAIRGRDRGDPGAAAGHIGDVSGTVC